MRDLFSSQTMNSRVANVKAAHFKQIIVIMLVKRRLYFEYTRHGEKGRMR